jgi:methylated-DNA-[protein]-cysteine S-methyltransferase
MSEFFGVIKTKAGFVGVVATERGVRRILLPEGREAVQRRLIRRAFPRAVEKPALLPELCQDLRRYFEGDAVEFDVAFDWPESSPFERAIWKACASVGYGETATYKSLAERVGRPGAARAVGLAMSRNPCPIVVPCHRVLRSNGALGGYSGPGGTRFKRALLDMEAAALAPVY